VILAVETPVETLDLAILVVETPLTHQRQIQVEIPVVVLEETPEGMLVATMIHS
jgi:hypothetical protein